MTNTGEWFIVNETHAPDLVCQRRLTQVDGNNDVVRVDWPEVVGPVMIITEHRYRLDAGGAHTGLVDSRTRLVVRSVADVSGNGSEYGITPSVVEDDETYKQFVFTTREAVSETTQAARDNSDPLHDLYLAHSQVMRTLAEITRLRDETVQIRDAALRAASATKKARGG